MFMSTLTRWLGASSVQANNLRVNYFQANSQVNSQANSHRTTSDDADNFFEDALEQQSHGIAIPVPSKSSKAIVDAAISPGRSGRIRYQGSWWSARCEQDITLSPGEEVRVVGRQNITLIVEPLAIALSK
ncbi:MAG TPA: NfeD family protein, partial [Allocoleopsis sp.]